MLNHNQFIQLHTRVLLGRAYFSLFSHISTFNKNYRCLEELIKITYDPHISPFELILISFVEKLIKINLKNVIQSLKIYHLNEKIVILKNYDKRKNRKKKRRKNRK